MMSSNRRKLYSSIGVIIAIVIGVTGYSLLSANDGLLGYEKSLATEEQWLTYARNQVKSLGMVGEPTHEEWALLSFGSYLTITGGPNETNTPRDMPMFIYKAFGDVPVLQGMSMASGRTDIGGFMLIYNADTGDPMFYQTYSHESIAKGITGLDLSVIPPDAGEQGEVPTLPTPVPEITQEAIQ